MIFSSKIYILKSGTNLSIYPNNQNSISLFLYENYLKEYIISKNNNNICVFNKMFNYDKIIKLNSNYSCICNNDCMNIVENSEL